MLTGNEITGNIANSFNYPRGGGGISIGYNGQAALINNLIAGNQSSTAGGALYVDNDSQSTLLHNTIARNDSGDGSGIYVAAGAITMTNTILVSHTVGISTTTAATVTLEATLWGSGVWANGTDWLGSGLIYTGTVNIWDDPAFVNAPLGDYHITELSAAVNAGVDAGVNEDIDGQHRPSGTGYDIGADEFQDQYTLYLPIVVKP